MKRILVSIFSAVTIFTITAITSGCGGGDSNSGNQYPEKSPSASYRVDGTANKMFLSGNNIFMTFFLMSENSEYGVYAINLNDPMNPSLTKKITTDYDVEGIAFDSDYVYILHEAWNETLQWYSKLVKLDAITLDAVGSPIEFEEFGTDIVISCGYAFAAFTGSDIGMRVIDLVSFSEKSSYNMTNGSYHVRADGTSVYLSGQTNALEIVDISSPESPAIISSYSNPFGSAPQDLYIFNDYALLSSGSYGVGIIDISDEENPAFVKFNDDPEYAKKIVSQGNMIFLADHYTGVIVIDASGGVDNFIIKGICRTSQDVQDMSVSGNYVYAASTDFSSEGGTGILEVFDVSIWMK